MRNRWRTTSRTAVLPADSLGEVPAAAAAAAAASALTAAWMRAHGKWSTVGTGVPEAGNDDESKPHADATAASCEPPDSAEAVWEAAWRGFAAQPGARQAGNAAAPLQGRGAGVVEPAASAGSQQEQQDDGQGAEERPMSRLSAEAAALQRTPLLLLQVGACTAPAGPAVPEMCLHRSCQAVGYSMQSTQPHEYAE